MKIDVMRKVDYFVGVPLCFFGDWIFFASSVYLAGEKSEYPRKVLFIELSEMGSTILADPAMRKMREKR
ncbi:hypothetical protein [Candidatus Competibacter phosphatis]|uniref:hypothetical protein n=1 Tax=Candidatus Competibacter phosphatis TaxID=221280 RepID=UPI001FEC2AF0|nr:hypothetical protein [Candidatus Competibacter phosphatis]